MSVRLVARIHPFDATKRIVKDIERASLREVYASLGVPLPIEHARFTINDRIARDYDEIPADGDMLFVNVVPGGAENAQQATGKGMGWAGFGMAVVGILLLPVNPFVAGALIGAGIASFTSGVVLYTTPIPGARDQIETAPYLRGSRNKSNLGGSAPLVLGRHRIAPHNGAAPYTEIVGDAQYLRQLFVIGQKDLAIEEGSWKIGDTELSKYDSEIGIVSDGSIPTLYPVVVLETGVGREIRHQDDEGASGAIVVTTPSNTRELLVDILFNGLVKFNDKNEKTNTVVTVIAEYKKSGEPDSAYISLGTWDPQDFFVSQATGEPVPNAIMGKTTKTKRYAITKFLDNETEAGVDWTPLRQYDVRLTRVTADSTKTDVIDKCYWGSLRSIQNIRAISAASQADLCVASLRIKSTGQLSGVVDQLSCVAALNARDYDGAGSGAAAWISRLTSNPASCYLYVLTSSSANPRPTADAKIDWPALEAWHVFCEENAYECNLVIDSEMDRDSLLAQVAQCGRAIPIKVYGKFSVVVDRARPAPTQMISSRNSWNYSGSKAFPEIPHALKLNFVNADLDWQTDQVVVYDDGYNRDGTGGKLPATIFQEIECRGVTDAAQVWKEGRYKLAASILRCESHTVSMDLEYLTANLGDRVLFSNDVILVGLAYSRILNLLVSGTDIIGLELDEELTIEAGKTYAVTVRTNTGMVTSEVSAAVGVTRELSLSVPIPESSGLLAGDLVTFGESGKVTIDAIVMDIAPADDMTATLTLVDYAPEIFDLIDDPELVIPPHDPMMSIPGSHRLAPRLAAVLDPDAAFQDTVDRTSGALWQDHRYQATTSPLVQPEFEADQDDPGVLWLTGIPELAEGEVLWEIVSTFRGTFRETPWVGPVIKSGLPGSPGVSGLTLWYSYNDNSPAVQPFDPIGSGTTLGWHADLTSTSMWVSHKYDSTRDGDADWSTPAIMPSVVAALNYTPKYLGRSTGAHPTPRNSFDWWLLYDTDDDPITRGVYYDNGGAAVRISAIPTDPDFTDDPVLLGKLVATFIDVAWCIANGYGTALNYGNSAYFEALGANSILAQFLLAQDIVATGSITGARIRSITGSGVNRRALEINDESLDWLDIPDTDPPTAERVRARIRRLGVGGEAIIEGDFNVPIDDQNDLYWVYLTEVHSSFGDKPAAVTDKDGQVWTAFFEQGNGLVEKIYNEIGAPGSSVPVDSAGMFPSYFVMPDGRVRMAFNDLNSPYYIYERIKTGSTWGARRLVSQEGNYPFYFREPDGKLYVYHTGVNATRIVRNLIDEDTDEIGDDEYISISGASFFDIETLPNKDLIMVYGSMSGYMYWRIRSSGVWGSATPITGEAHMNTLSMVRDLRGNITIFFRDIAYMSGDTGGLVSLDFVDNDFVNRKLLLLETWNSNEEAFYPEAFPLRNGNVLILAAKATSSTPTYSTISAILTRCAPLGAGFIEKGTDDSGAYYKTGDGQVWRPNINRVILASDVVNNNSTANTIANVTGLSFPVKAGKRYKFRFFIRYTSAATTTGSRWSINGPSSPTELAYKSTYALSETQFSILNEYQYDMPSSASATSRSTSGNMAEIEGIIMPSADGTVIARFASEIASSAITAKAGSYVEYEVLE